MKKQLFKLSIVIISLIAFVYAMAQDAPLGYTTWFKLRYWDEDAHPSADSVNQNLKDIDTHLHNRDVRIDSAKSAISWMFNYPAGTFKRYSSAEFDDDTLKVKSGVFPKLADNNSFSGTNTFTSGEVKFDQTGSAGSTLNFIYSDGAGGVFINKNTFTSLLKFDEGDGNYWQFGYPITVAGDVDITGTFKKNGAGLYLFDSLKTSHNITGDTVKANYIKADLDGGNITKGNLPDARLSSNIPRLDTRQTYTKRNVYSDTLKADGLSQMEQVKIADWVNISGDVTSDLNFAKGSTTRIGTIDANSLQIIKQDTAYITLDNSGISIARNIVPADTKGLFWSTSSVASSSGILTYKSSNHNFATRYSNNVMTLDSGNGMLMYANKFMFMDTVNSWIQNYNPYAMYLGTNSGTAMKIDSLNNIRMYENMSVDGSITSALITTANISSTVLADLNEVAFNGSVTTDMSFTKGDIPNIGTTDNFGLNLITNNTTAIKIGTDTITEKLPVKVKDKPLVLENSNGAKQAIMSTNSSGDLVISTNRAVAITGDLTVSGYTRNGDLSENEKTKVIRMYLDTLGINKIDHGFTGNGFQNILGQTLIVKHDTTANTGKMLPGGSNLAAAITPGVNIWYDSLKVNYNLPSTATGLLGDTILIRIVYTNIY